jgi:hypothetical protein
VDVIVVARADCIGKMDGANRDPSLVRGISGWLEDAIVAVPEIEEFERRVSKESMR